jgi:hypothetical protein
MFQGERRQVVCAVIGDEASELAGDAHCMGSAVGDRLDTPDATLPQ